MNPLMKRFVLRSSMLTAILLIAGYLVYRWVIPEFYSHCILYILIFFFLITNILHYLLLKIKDKSIRKFPTYFMGINFVKMLVYLAFAVIVIIFHKPHARIFLINFLIIYITFSVLEVSEIARIMKRKN